MILVAFNKIRSYDMVFNPTFRLTFAFTKWYDCTFTLLYMQTIVQKDKFFLLNWMCTKRFSSIAFKGPLSLELLQFLSKICTKYVFLKYQNSLIFSIRKERHNIIYIYIYKCFFILQLWRKICRTFCFQNLK